MSDRINNTQDVIDSQTVDRRIAYLERWEDEDDPDLFDDDERDELAALRKLRDEATDYAGEWRHGVALIHDLYFVEYIKEDASESYGKEIRDARWPFNHIDWEAAAEEYKQDWTKIDFDGEPYWIENS